MVVSEVGTTITFASKSYSRKCSIDQYGTFESLSTRNKVELQSSMDTSIISNAPDPPTTSEVINPLINTSN